MGWRQYKVENAPELVHVRDSSLLNSRWIYSGTCCLIKNHESSSFWPRGRSVRCLGVGCCTCTSRSPGPCPSEPVCWLVLQYELVSKSQLLLRGISDRHEGVTTVGIRRRPRLGRPRL